MFSIENLAWRDKRAKKNEFEEYGLSPEQRGPLGGRIMWFPPYNLNFSEDVSVDWNGNQFTRHFFQCPRKIMKAK